jgi:hypothetical protein
MNSILINQSTIPEHLKISNSTNNFKFAFSVNGQIRDKEDTSPAGIMGETGSTGVS